MQSSRPPRLRFPEVTKGQIRTWEEPSTSPSSSSSQHTTRDGEDVQHLIS